MPSNLNSRGIRFIGKIPDPQVDSREYDDYIDHIQRMDVCAFKIQLNIGTFPPGLVFLPDNCVPGVIRGMGEKQVVERITFKEGIRI